MKIVFLDIDGVLNTSYTKEMFQGFTGIDSACLHFFSDFFKKANEIEATEVVLTSSWRLGETKDGNPVMDGYWYVYDTLKSVGITLFDVTPVCYKGGRGSEIAKWLIDHKDLDITGYVVLDDVLHTSFRTLGLTKRMIRTSWSKPNGGFTQKHIERALETLMLPFYEPQPKDY